VGTAREGFIPMVASNVIYLEELKRLMIERYRFEDDEEFMKSMAMRNQEEFILRKKNNNIVDDMQLKAIGLEKQIQLLIEVICKLLEQTL
jgi:hypothetical protein